MADIRITNSHPAEDMHDERRRAAEVFAEELRAEGLDVDLDMTERVPGIYRMSLMESTAIFIGNTVATALVTATADDLYAKAKRMLHGRRKAKKDAGGGPGGHLGFVIYGPDGDVLRRWSTKEDDADPS
jgi:hypothetical protein